MCAKKRKYIRRPRIEKDALKNVPARKAVKIVVHTCIKFIKADERRIIQAFCFENMTQEEVAKKEKITAKYAKRKLRIAKVHLRDTIVKCIGMEKVKELLKGMRYS